MLNWTRDMGVKRWRTRALDRGEWAYNLREAKPAQKLKNLSEKSKSCRPG